MLFFRSEERVREWCEAKGLPVRPTVTTEQLWNLSAIWYATRLSPNSRRPKPEEMVSIFAGVGLTGDFWNPASDRFG
ncbi:MAG TPA: hypothetical protein VFU59_11035 [Candidatus Eisenbacteria bacterium]|nr:hypothetical protein [Candidatus Eisenbacteria bacterium]